MAVRFRGRVIWLWTSHPKVPYHPIGPGQPGGRLRPVPSLKEVAGLLKIGVAMQFQSWTSNADILKRRLQLDLQSDILLQIKR